MELLLKDLIRTSSRGVELLLKDPNNWDTYKGSPMLELWTASTRNLGEPQVPD